MDSSIPPPPSLVPRRLRPWHLVPAMALAWCAGVHGLMTGLANVAFLRGAVLPDTATAARNAEGGGDFPEFFALFNATELAAMHQIGHITLPLSLAQILLAGLLVIGSGLALGSRRGARALALQALSANAILTAVTYALTFSVRAAAIDAWMNAALTLPEGLPQRAIFPTREALWWWVRLRAGCEIGLLALGALSLTRARTKTYFDAVDRAAESAEEP